MYWIDFPRFRHIRFFLFYVPLEMKYDHGRTTYSRNFSPTGIDYKFYSIAEYYYILRLKYSRWSI